MKAASEHVQRAELLQPNPVHACLSMSGWLRHIRKTLYHSLLLLNKETLLPHIKPENKTVKPTDYRSKEENSKTITLR